MATLIFITTSFPLGGITESTFIRPEIEALCSRFDRVVLVPVTDEGGAEALPSNAVVTRALAGRLPLWKRLKGMFSLNVARLLLADRRYIRSLKDLRGAIAVAVYTAFYRERLSGLIEDLHLDPAETLIYNFWFTAPAIAATEIEGIRSVSRAHGHDIYPEQGVYLSHSLRDAALAKMLGVYTASEAGKEYMHKHYPDRAAKIVTRRLGSRDPEGLNPGDGRPGETTLLCVARTEAVKRVPLMCQLLKSWAASRPDLNIRFIYVGDGSMMPMVRETVAETPSNLTVEILGALDNSEVHRLLATRHVDAVLLTSFSEGAPVILLESLSYGVPVIATAVGGVPEIATAEVGALLSPTPSAEEFIAVMNRELPLLAGKRQTARHRWETEFRASRLREDFARDLRALIS